MYNCRGTEFNVDSAFAVSNELQPTGIKRCTVLMELFENLISNFTQIRVQFDRFKRNAKMLVSSYYNAEAFFSKRCRILLRVTPQPAVETV